MNTAASGEHVDEGSEERMAVVAQPWLPAKWDRTADVVVIGYGGAGAVSAITASDAGADVLVLEKAPYVANRVNTLWGKSYPISGGGGTTAMSGGVSGYPDDPAAFARLIYNFSWGSTPKNVCETYANFNLKPWYEKMGLPYKTGSYESWYPAIGTVTMNLLMHPGGGPGLFSDLDARVMKRKIPVLLGTPATGLIQDPVTGGILGVKACDTATGNALNILARKAVILCSGGFEFDEEMKLNNLHEYPMHFFAWQYNTGDGIKIAQKAGAGLWHMNCVAAHMGPWFPDNPSPSAYTYTANFSANSFIYVDKYGKRYASERNAPSGVMDFGPGEGYPSYLFQDWWDAYTWSFEPKTPEFTRIPSFIIFDEALRESAPLVTPFGSQTLPAELGGAPRWSSDNRAEIAKGWILKSDTIAGLAEEINKLSPLTGIYPGLSDNDGPPSSITVNMDPAVLAKTVSDYNTHCSNKDDPDFDRLSSTLTPISEGPFYAVPLWPGGPNTQGGPIRNASGQVCGPDGSPIPRLYSAGECGSIWGFLYQGPGNLTEALVYGIISGANAAAETPL